MQTAFRTSQGWTGTADYSLSKFVPHPKGNLGTEKKDTSATGKHNAFLTGRITPLAPDYWHQDMDNDSPVNLTTPENFDYLYRSASRYAELMGIKLPFRYRKGENFRPVLNGERYITDSELAEKLKLTRRTLADYRMNGRLPYYKVGGKLLYKEKDILVLLEKNRVETFDHW